MALRSPEDQQPKTQVVGKPFQKGKSGNPGGRPVLDKEVKELALKACPAAFNELIRIAQEGLDERTRVAAIKEILDRALGKSHQAITAEVKGNIRFSVSVREIDTTKALPVVTTAKVIDER